MKNFKVLGLHENDQRRDHVKELEDLFLLQMGISDPVHMQKTRTKKRRIKEHTNRPLLVKFLTEEDRQMVWRGRKSLHDTGVILKEDLPDEMEQRARQLQPYLQKT